MATFAKASFGHASYAAFRPTYPPSLYNMVVAYHQGPKKLCLDLGCGPGTATRELARHFERAIGTDPSAGMVAQAKQLSAAARPPIEFRQASAESSAFLADGSVDCVVAAQAAHWFDQARLWPELRRLVRPRGTVAFWGYKDNVFVDFPRASEILMFYAYDSHPDRLGSYWPQPGRSYVQDKLRVVQPPPADWDDLQRLEYEPDTRGKGSGQGTRFMEMSVSVGGYKEYIRTWSPYHGWKEAHPGREPRSKGGDGDIADEIIDEIAKHDELFRRDEEMVDIEWGSVLLMARRK